MTSRSQMRTRFAPLITFVRRLNVDIDDCLGVVGLALVAYGAGLIYRPAAFIVVGVALLAASVLGARRR